MKRNEQECTCVCVCVCFCLFVFGLSEDNLKQRSNKRGSAVKGQKKKKKQRHDVNKARWFLYGLHSWLLACGVEGHPFVMCFLHSLKRLKSTQVPRQVPR